MRSAKLFVVKCSSFTYIYRMLSDDSSGSVVFEHNFDENDLSASQVNMKHH